MIENLNTEFINVNKTASHLIFPKCNFKNLNMQESIIEKCSFASQFCHGSYFNTYALYYCDLEGNNLIMLPFLLILITLCFYMFSTTADKYLSPSLTVLSEKLKLSPSIAAMTFLSFGNGAPDVISSIVASSSSSSEGLTMSIGALLGAGICVTCFVFSMVVFFSPKDYVKVVPMMFSREIICYLIALISIMIFGMDNRIYRFEALCFAGLYFVNLFLAITKEKLFKRHSLVINTESDIIKVTDEEEKLRNEVVENSFFEMGKRIHQPYERDAENEDLDKGEKLLDTNQFNDSNHSTNSKSYHPHHSHSTYIKMKNHYTKTVFNDWDTQGIFMKVFTVVFVFPMTIIRDLSIPAVDEENYLKEVFVLSPLFSVVTIITFLKSWETVFSNTKIFLFCFSFILFFTFLLSVFMEEKIPENDFMIIITCIYSFIISIFWMWAISKNLISFLKFLGVVFNIPLSFLGLTLLAMGNSAPDASLDVSLSKQGQAEMGISGAISGPLFNLLIGLGVSLVRMTLKSKKGYIDFQLWHKNNLPNIFTLFTLALSLFAKLVVIMYTDFKVTRLSASISLGFFVLYIIGVTAVTFLY